jgi:hypothetical protein
MTHYEAEKSFMGLAVKAKVVPVEWCGKRAEIGVCGGV